MTTASHDTPSSSDSLNCELERERKARIEAERQLEETSRKLSASNRELKSIAEAMEKEVQRTKAVFDTAAEGILIFEANGLVESLNVAARKIFGLSDKDSQRIYLCELLPNIACCSNCRAIGFADSLIEITKENAEVTGVRRDGGTVSLEFVVSEFEHGGKRSYSGILRDLTKKKLLESQLSQAQKLESVGQLAAGIAHELNTPIQFVGDNTRFLKSAFESIDRILETIETLVNKAIEIETIQPLAEQVQKTCEEADLDFIREEVPLAIDQTLLGVENVSRIVQAMKVFSHPGTTEFQEVDLNQSLQSTLTVSRNEWKYYAELVTNFDPDLPRVACMPAELNQAFLNLIVNAAHAMQGRKDNSKGTLTVTTRCEGESVIIEIGDTGTGIPVNIRNRIFDPFFTTKGVGKGTGQGLSICYNIIAETHHGSITFESEVNVGTTFRVMLPISQKPLNSKPPLL